MKANEVKHPAKYTDALLPIFAEELIGKSKVIDIFAGTCKISKIKDFGYVGEIYCNEIEPEWANMGVGKVDNITTCDAESLPYRNAYFDAICTSPTYANRMADSHNAKDNSVRNTYTHKIGRKLNEENTGAMQWGRKYRDKHLKIWREAKRILKPGGVLILNISNHIRKGEIVYVSDWHVDTLINMGFSLEKEVKIETPRNRFGSNSDKRVPYESVFILNKSIEEEQHG